MISLKLFLFVTKGVYQIMSLSGRIIPLKTGEIDGDINLVMSDAHGATVGGKVQNLVAETTVEVITFLINYRYVRYVVK